MTWGLMMTLVGMGTVFLLLALLMVVLYLVGMLDRPQKEEPAVLAAATPASVQQSSVLSVDEIAALSLALAMEDDTAIAQHRTATHTRRPGSWTNSGRTRLHNHAQRI